MSSRLKKQNKRSNAGRVKAKQWEMKMVPKMPCLRVYETGTKKITVKVEVIHGLNTVHTLESELGKEKRKV